MVEELPEIFVQRKRALVFLSITVLQVDQSCWLWPPAKIREGLLSDSQLLLFIKMIDPARYKIIESSEGDFDEPDCNVDAECLELARIFC